MIVLNLFSFLSQHQLITFSGLHVRHIRKTIWHAECMANILFLYSLGYILSASVLRVWTKKPLSKMSTES